MVIPTLTQIPTGRPSREIIKTQQTAEEAAHRILHLSGQAPPPAALEPIPFHPGEAQAADHTLQDLLIAPEAADLPTAADHLQDQFQGAVGAVLIHQAHLQGRLHHPVLHQAAAEGVRRG